MKQGTSLETHLFWPMQQKNCDLEPIIVGQKAFDSDKCMDKIFDPFLKPNGKPIESLNENLKNIKNALKELLIKHRIKESDILFFPYCVLPVLLGINKCLKALCKPSPKLVFHWVFLWQQMAHREHLSLNKAKILFLRGLKELNLAMKPNRVVHFTDTHSIALEFGKQTGLTFTTLGIPIHPDFNLSHHVVTKEKVTIGFMGDTRFEKGGHRLPALLQQMDSKRLRWVFQLLTQKRSKAKELENLIIKHKNGHEIIFHSGRLAHQDYVKCLKELDLLLLPYEVEPYRTRTSGIFAEAVHSGIPVIVPKGTWMDEQLDNHGAGLIFDPKKPF